MSYTTLIDVPTLAAHITRRDWVLVDCRFTLGDPEQGAREHAEATIAGAVYAHLDRDLSGPIEPGVTGRHPLPKSDAFAETLGRLGIDNSTQVVAFDDKGGAFASRLWWMMRWVGHRAVAVLDGGLPAWTAAGHTLAAGRRLAEVARFEVAPSMVTAVKAKEVLKAIGDKDITVFDARAAERYSGEQEGTDPVAGHIAGARSLPFAGNLGPEGRFLGKEALASRFNDLVGEGKPGKAIAYCGSGVTACHNVLAMVHAGLPAARLYPGSWSEWITDESRPRATGPDT